jgi:hypothetical protein
MSAPGAAGLGLVMSAPSRARVGDKYFQQSRAQQYERNSEFKVKIDTKYESLRIILIQEHFGISYKHFFDIVYIIKF